MLKNLKFKVQFKQMDTVVKPITDISQLDPEGRYTYADYLLWRLKERVELIRGRILKMSPAPGTAHQHVSGNIQGIFWNYFKGKSCKVFAAPFDVRLPVSRKKGQDSTVVQPDLCVICDDSKLDERGCAGAPDLIVEILSPGNSKRELKIKFEVYEEAGVREYWVVNPLEKVVLVFVLNEAGKYIGLAPLVDDDTLKAHIFPELALDLREVFA
ncbi:MAG: Uma2 family endonuclease [Saprospiraceae bacterium]|nr:Uma2 family endonuclease [Saprospiraceae bacterium]